MVKLIVLLLLLTGCGAFKTQERLTYNSSFDKEVTVYFDKKEEHQGTRQMYYDVSMDFGTLLPPKIGLCEFESKQDALGRVTHSGVITIDPMFWVFASYAKREALILHELGHCDLRLDHTNESDKIMSPRLMPSSTYRRNRDSLIEEMFNSRKYM